MVERLRKDAFDRGIFAALTFLFYNIPSGSKLTDLKAYIKDKVLNLIELNDLYYHASVIEQLIEILKQNPNTFNVNSNEGENDFNNQSMDGTD